MRRIVSFGAAGVLALALTPGLGMLTGCRDEGPAEKAGEHMDEAMEKVTGESGSTMEEAGRKMDEATDKASEKMGEAADQMGDKMDEAAEEARETMHEAEHDAQN